jgi:TorA maturation chaperone TorD
MKMNIDSDNDNLQRLPLAEVYNFLALCMRYPDSLFLDNDFFDVFENLLDALELTNEYDTVHRWRINDTQRIETLQIEYTRLFINTAPQLIAPPYGSFYLDGDNSLQGKSTEKTRDFYRLHSYDITNTSEPADHIRIELEFLAALARENNSEAEDDFLRLIFRPWFTLFYTRIMQQKIHLFYKVSVQLIDIFTKEEQ